MALGFHVQLQRLAMEAFGFLESSLSLDVAREVRYRQRADAARIAPELSRYLERFALCSFCFCVPDKHTFTINVANGYAAKGGVPRYESATRVSDRLHFLQTHSIDPSDVFNPAQFVNLARTGHPSPITHTVKYVRMCLLAFVGIGNWKFDGAAETNGSAQANVAVTFNRAYFRTRGMPAEPTGAISGLDVGILWGLRSPTLRSRTTCVQTRSSTFSCRYRCRADRSATGPCR